MAIDSLAHLLCVPPERMHLHSFEIGLNLENPPFDVTTAKDSLILLGSKPFRIWESDYGRVAKHSQYHLKGYDKGLQASVGHPIFRMELPVKKMQVLVGRGIATLADLKDRDKLRSLFEWFFALWESVLVYDPGVNLGRLNPREKEFWQFARYVEHWERSMNARQRRANSDKAKAIIAQQVPNSLHSQILSKARAVHESLMVSVVSYQLLPEWAQLPAVDFLPTFAAAPKSCLGRFLPFR